MAIAESKSKLQLTRTLQAKTRAHEQRLAASARSESERDEAIRAAHAGGVTPSEISRITGLSKQRVDQIRRGSRI